MKTISHNRLCHNAAKNSPQIPSTHEGAKPYSGFLILRLSKDLSQLQGDDLVRMAQEYKLVRMADLLGRYKPDATRRVISSASSKQLAEMEERARHSEFPPLNSLASYWRLDYRNFDGDLEEVAKLFGALREVETAYREYAVFDPVVNAADDTFAANQGYLDAAPTGIDARWAWTQANGEGAGVGFIDLEQGWIPTHEDLAAAGPTLIFNDNRHGVGAYIGNHGTAVLGQVMGVDNTRGIVGIAPSIAYTRMVSHYESATNTALHVADAIVAAIQNMSPGDVLLLEVARGNGPEYPTEIDDADFDAIRLASALGIIVVEAGGNGGPGGVARNLDTWTTGGGAFRMNRGHADFRDSGAIMVGAAVSTVPHNKTSWSNFGSRIDCYGWGQNIVTAGYGDLAGGGTATRNDDYTSGFNGTSGASPIVTGAALIVQGMYKATTGAILSPAQMRSLLSNPATGTPQGGAVAGNIGVMPNLRAIIENTLGLTPDVYLRDNVGDTGAVPTAGSISASPDIIVRPDQVADPTAAFGEGSGTENSAMLGYTVEAGQNNYIYVRMKNRGNSPANGVTATVYWSEVATLITPNMWNLVGTTAAVNVPVGDTLVVTDAITWNKASIPGPGHYCFVGLLNHAQDAAPPIPGPADFDWDAFRSFVRNNNNVTWRNFNVQDVLPDDPSYTANFLIANAPDNARRFDFEIMRALPEGAQLWMELPANLYPFMKIRGAKVIADDKQRTVRVLLPALRSIYVCGVELPKDARFRCRFVLEGGRGYERGVHHIAIRQIHAGEEVGRVTWALRTAKAQLAARNQSAVKKK